MTHHHAGVQPARNLALLRWQQLMALALRGLNGQVTPSTRDEAPGLCVYGAPTCALIALSAGGRDTTLRHALPAVTTMVPVTADSSLHDGNDTRGLG